MLTARKSHKDFKFIFVSDRGYQYPCEVTFDDRLPYIALEGGTVKLIRAFRQRASMHLQLVMPRNRMTIKIIRKNFDDIDATIDLGKSGPALADQAFGAFQRTR